MRESDIEDRMNNEVLDFLTCEDKWDGDIITNPPYSKAKEFVEKSLELIKDGGKVAMFLKLTFLEGQARRNCLNRILRRLCMYSPSGRTALETAIFLHTRQIATCVMRGLCGKRIIRV